MDKTLFGLFFDDCEGIFACLKNNENCEAKKEEAKEMLTQLNTKISNNDVTNLEIKVFNTILIELVRNSGKREYSDLLLDVQKIMKDAFLTLEEYKYLKGE